MADWEPTGEVPAFEVELPGARAVFSTRLGGVSERPYDTLNLGILTDDDRDRVRENRRRLAGRIGVAGEAVAMGWQVHGADLQEWHEPPRSRFTDPDTDLRKVDGHVTELEDVALLVLAADCLPIALSGGGRVAMLHCGWRGLAAGIVERVLEHFHEPPAAVVGPGIGACCYEVGEEVLAAFGAGGPTLDLRGIAAERLAGSEVRHVDLCTSCNPELFFSHRRDGQRTGRQAGAVIRTP
ncbi:MAG: purine-nucleoside/S-methyl-5-thioadenosine phosphorylase / adenosine deaminase [Thermoleophilaceae bacterium]|nr:purine-nucleoside/S-methyl-5-thioadenosine phosphorylase / adenosine deaminase [Thermoleophilaceae bacterium]